MFALHRLFSELPELERRYWEGSMSHKESKDILFENMNKMIAPLRERYRALRTDETSLRMILEQGNAAARTKASETLDSVKTRIGML